MKLNSSKMKEMKFPGVPEALEEGKSAMGVKRLKPKGEGRGGTEGLRVWGRKDRNGENEETLRRFEGEKK